MDMMDARERWIRAGTISQNYQKRMKANLRSGGSSEEFEWFRIQARIADRIRARATRGIGYDKGSVLKPGAHRGDLKLDEKSRDYYSKMETLASLDLRDYVLEHPEYFRDRK